MIKKIMIIFMLIILFLSTLSGFIGFASGGLGSQEDFVEDFEDDTLGEQAEDYYYGDRWFYTENYGNAWVSNAYGHSGTKCYELEYESSSLFTMNVGGIYNITMFVRPVDYATADYVYISFNNATNDTIIEVRFVEGDPSKFYLEYHAWDDSWIQLGGEVSENAWHDFGFNITAIDTVTYFWSGNLYSGTPNTITDNMGESGINYAYIDNLAVITVARSFAIDDFTIVQGYTEPPEEEGSIPPCTPYSTIGNVGIGNIGHAIGLPYLWTVYGVETRMYVHRMDLEVAESYIQEITINDIEAKLGTYSLGTPNSIVEISAGHYRISWTGLNCYINNTPCPIMFKFKKNYGTELYPIYSFLFFTDEDLNNDGLRFCLVVGYDHNSFWDNFKYKVDHQPDLPPTASIIRNIINRVYHLGYQIQDYEPVIRLCADRLTTGELKYHFDNDIWCYPRTFENNSFTEIGYTVNLSQMGESNKVIMIEEPDHNVKTIKTISTQSGGKIYTAHQTGLHYVNLSLGGVNVSSTTFTTVGSLDDWVETDPNPSYPNQDFNIIYNYSKSGMGVIRIFDSDNALKQTFIVNPTSSGTETTSLDEGKYYIKLQEVIEIAGRSDYVTLFTLPHAVQGDVVPFIEVEQDVVSVDYDFRIYGKHNHIGHNIVVRVGDSEEIDVSDFTGFNFWHGIEKSGYYRVSLIVKKPDKTEVELDWDYITVKSTLFEDDDKTGVENLLDMIPDFYKVLAGIIITLAVTLSPFIFLIKASKYIGKPININIPPISYPLLFIGGTMLSTKLGLFGIEILFLFLAGAFISIVFLYISGMKSGQVEGNE